MTFTVSSGQELLIGAVLYDLPDGTAVSGTQFDTGSSIIYYPNLYSLDGLTVEAGGQVDAGGPLVTITNAIVNGRMSVEGGEVDNVIVSGGTLYLAPGLFVGGLVSVNGSGFTASAGGEIFEAGGNLTSTTVAGGGYFDVYGTANGTVVASGGHMVVESGGLTSGTIVNSGGTVENLGEMNGLIINGGTVQDGANFVSDATFGSGPITFAGSGGELYFPTPDGNLETYDGTLPNNVIRGFTEGDSIVLQTTYSSNDSAALIGSILDVTLNGASYLFNLDPTQNYSGAKFTVVRSEGSGEFNDSRITVLDVLDAPPTLLALGQLAYDVYSPASPQGPQGIPGWTLFYFKSDGEFQGAAYKSPDGTQIVVAFRGTDPILTWAGFKNVLTDAASFPTGNPSAGMQQIVADGSEFLAQVAANNPGANITLTGHSLGGAAAQLIGEAAGLNATTFNAPGAQQLYQNLQTQLQPALALASSNPFPGGKILNVRTEGDIVSLLNLAGQVGSTATLIPAPDQPTDSFYNVFANHNLAKAILPDLNAPTGNNLQPGVVENSLVEQLASQILYPKLINSVWGQEEFALAYIANAALNYHDWIDPPSASALAFTEDSNSPLITSVMFTGDPDISFFDVQTQLGNVWSAPELVSAGVTFVFSGGATGFEVEGISSNGQTVALPDGYLFDVAYASAGTVSATLLDIAPFTSTGTVASGQTISSVIVGSDGVVDVDGVAYSTTVLGGGTVIVDGGGIANGTYVSSGGSEVILSGGAANGDIVSSGGVVNVSSGGQTFGDLLVGSGSSGYAFEFVSNGGVASGTVMTSAGAMHVSSGGLLLGGVVGDGGNLQLYAGSASGTTLSGSASMQVFSDGTASGIIVSSGGYMAVSSGGVASDTTVSDGGLAIVFSGGTAGDTIVSSGGTFELLNGAILAGNTTLLVGATEEIGPGNSISGFTVSSGVTLEIAPGASASDTILLSGGTLVVLNGGTATGTISSGGEVVTSGNVVTSGEVVTSGQTLFVSSGQTSIDITVQSGGSEIVLSGGVANGTIVNSGGNVSVSAGGTLVSATVHGGVGSNAFINVGLNPVGGGGTTIGTQIIGSSTNASVATLEKAWPMEAWPPERSYRIPASLPWNRVALHTIRSY
jgi:autotransporter passenger strand-loop-strand repeat protein